MSLMTCWNCNVHLRQGFLHVLDMLAGHLHQIVAVPHQRTHRAHIPIRAERGMQQSHRMQILDPLALMKIRALTRHVLHIPRIHQTRLDAVLLQHVVDGNPINPSGLHRRRGDATAHQPFGHLVQIAGEGFALSHRMLVPSRRYGHEDLPGPDVDAGRIRLKHRIPRILPLVGTLALGYLRSRFASGNRLLSWLRLHVRSFVRANGQAAHKKVLF
jgi:hypothetical protein